MPTPTWTPMATITLSSTDSEINFSNIPNTYRDLIFVLSVTTDTSSNLGLFRINGDSGSNYTMVGMRGNGTNTASYTTSTTYAYFDYAGDTAANTRATVIIQFLDYSATDKHKTSLTRNSNENDAVEAMAQRWASTSAISSVSFYWQTGSFQSGSTLSLYGVIA